MSKTKEALKMAIEALEKVTFEYGQLLDGDQDYGLLPSETNGDIVIAHRVIRICKAALAEQLYGNSRPFSDDEIFMICPYIDHMG